MTFKSNVTPGFFSLLRPQVIATSEDKKFAATAQGVKK